MDHKKSKRRIILIVLSVFVAVIAALLYLWRPDDHKAHRILPRRNEQPPAAREESPWQAPDKKIITGDLPEMLKRNTIRVLIPFSKTNYFLSGGEEHGFEYSLLKEYGKSINEKRTRRELQVAIEFIPTPNHLLISGILNGWGDIAAAGLTVIATRQEMVDFTEPYLTGINEIIISHKAVEGLDSIWDLSGRRIFVRRASSYYESLELLNEKLKSRDLAPVEILTASEYLSTEDIIEMVNAGIIEITAADGHIAALWSKVFPNIKAHSSICIRKGGSIAWMVRKDNPQLKNSLSQFIESHKKGTLLGNIYFNRYFKSTKWIKNPLKPSDVQRLLTYEKLFKKYAAKYGFDWKLIAAQAYQESGLNHSRRSEAGAIGLMQLMPQLSKEERVGIDDIEDLENNIHAGIKYLALIRDTYFNDENITPAERTYFTLAAYNAGPARIKKARELALKMGYDSNKWFRNTELGALKLIGQETVRYVSNINKYYTAYTLFEKLDDMRHREKGKLKAGQL